MDSKAVKGNTENIERVRRLTALLNELALEADNLLLEGRDLKFEILHTIDDQKKNKILNFIKNLPHS